MSISRLQLFPKYFLIYTTSFSPYFSFLDFSWRHINHITLQHPLQVFCSQQNVLHSGYREAHPEQTLLGVTPVKSSPLHPDFPIFQFENDSDTQRVSLEYSWCKSGDLFSLQSHPFMQPLSHNCEIHFTLRVSNQIFSFQSNLCIVTNLGCHNLQHCTIFSY